MLLSYCLLLLPVPHIPIPMNPPTFLELPWHISMLNLPKVTEMALGYKWISSSILS